MERNGKENKIRFSYRLDGLEFLDQISLIEKNGCRPKSLSLSNEYTWLIFSLLTPVTLLPVTLESMTD